jgi:O-succinylbenzoate synthase
VKTLIDFDNAVLVALPVTPGFGEPGPRVCMLIEGPQGWGEFSPPRDVDDRQAARWLTAAVEPGTVGWPDAVRGRVPVAVQVPAVDPAAARELVVSSGCRTAEVAVSAGSVDAACARVEVVRDVLGPGGRIRCVVQGEWDVETAVSGIAALLAAAGGLEYVELPVGAVAWPAEVRRRIDVPVAADVAGIASWSELARHADIAVLSCAALGGVRRSLRAAEATGLPCVVRAERQSSVGLAGAAALAGALPELPLDCAIARPPWVTADVTTESRALVSVAGVVPVAPMPPRPEPEMLARWVVTDGDALRWWRSRLARVRTASH